LHKRKLEPIYIGESENLQKQFSEYVDSDFQDNICKQKNTFLSKNFYGRSIREEKNSNQTIREQYGRLPECNSE
jgi:hypothetical protein